MLDDKLNPWVIEVNHAPSLGTDSLFDKAIKLQLVEDTLRLLNLSHKRKSDYIKTERQNFQQRTRTGKSVYKLTPEQKEEKRKEIDKKRDELEKDLLGGYELIYPLEDTPQNKETRELYEQFIEKSQQIYDKFNIGRKKFKSNNTHDSKNNNDNKDPIGRKTRTNLNKDETQNGRLNNNRSNNLQATKSTPTASQP